MSDDKDKAEELPQLTDKQMNYVLGIQSGLTKTAAYRQAYDCSGSADKTVWANAARLATDNSVAPWIELVKRSKITAGITELEYTKERYLKDLAECGEACRAAGAWSTYFKSIEATGKSCGHVVNAVEISHTNKADTDLLEQLEKLLGKDAAHQAALKMGYQVQDTVDTKELH